MNAMGHNSLCSPEVDVDGDDVVVRLGLEVVVSFESASEVVEIDVLASSAMAFDGMTRKVTARIKKKLMFFMDAKFRKGFIVWLLATHGGFLCDHCCPYIISIGIF